MCTLALAVVERTAVTTLSFLSSFFSSSFLGYANSDGYHNKQRHSGQTKSAQRRWLSDCKPSIILRRRPPRVWLPLQGIAS